MWYFLVLVAVIGASNASPLSYGNFSMPRLHESDYEFLATLPRHHIGTVLPGFKYIYVNPNGQITYTRGARGSQFAIAGSPGTQMRAIQVAAQDVAKMLRYMPPTIFSTLSKNAEMGIFSAREKLTIFPEYAYLKNGNCGRSCSGSCARTCTFDGRKYEDIAGVGGQRAVILDDNVLCSARDPYNHKENILAHEYTHTIHQYGVASSVKQKIAAAYNAAKSRRTWRLNSYAMANDKEYFAEGATVFMGINVLNKVNTGGMNECGTGYCNTERLGKNHLKTSDVSLYNQLLYVFQNNNVNAQLGMRVCPSSG